MLTLLRIRYEIASPHSRLQGDKRLRYPVTERQGQVARVRQLQQERAAPFHRIRRSGMRADQGGQRGRRKKYVSAPSSI